MEFVQRRFAGRKIPTESGRSRFPLDQFCEPPDIDFICSICRDVLDNPLMTPCLHTFCGVCIEQVHSTRPILENGIPRIGNVRQRCPNCRKDFCTSQLRSPSLALQNLLKKLKMRCPHGGCEKELVLEDYCKHEGKCGFATITCPFRNCEEIYRRKDLEQHKANCDYRPVLCPKKCGEEIQHKNLNDHFYNSCERGFRKCDKCGEIYPYLRRDQHDCIKVLLQKMEGMNVIITNQSVEMNSIKSEFASIKNMVSDMAKKIDGGDAKAVEPTRRGWAA